MVNVRRERDVILNDITQLRIQIAQLQLQEEILFNELRGTIENPVAKVLGEREMVDCEKLYNYVNNHYKWRIKSVEQVEDKTRIIRIINFYNEETQENISFDPMANLNKFVEFVVTHGIASSNVHHITPARAIDVANKMNVGGPQWRLELTDKLILVNLGNMGFMALVNAQIATNSIVKNVIPIFNINYHGSPAALLNYQYIRSLTETSMQTTFLPRSFDKSSDMVNYLKTYLPKRPSNILMTKLSVLVNGTFYTYKYKGKTGAARVLYMISLEDDAGYHGYHTWMLTRNEFLTFKAMTRGHTRIKDVVVNAFESK